MKNHKTRILNYLRKNGSITQLEASDELRMTRLSPRITELIKSGVNIEKMEIENPDIQGKVGNYVRYYLVDK